MIIYMTILVFSFSLAATSAWSLGESVQQESDAGSLAGGSIDASSGALTHAIPISVPPGPGGLSPTLALTYSSKSGDGVAGVGWDLSIDRISCSTRFGIPDYAACERFERNGELLVGGEPDSSGQPRYHSLEESFDRIRRLPGDAWEVTSTDGTRNLFGSTPDSRLTGGAGTAVWLLKSTIDVFGNEISYSYTQPPDDHGTAYLVAVSYAGQTRRVELRYVARPDVVERFAGGRRSAMTQRLAEVVVRSGSEGAVSYRLELEYAAAAGDPAGYTTARSRLVAVTKYGSDCVGEALPSAQGCTGLPPQRFAYSDTPESVDAQVLEDPSIVFPGDFISKILGPYKEQSPGSIAYLNSFGAAWGDVNGDGLVDIVRADCYVPCTTQGPGTFFEVYLNNGNGWEQTKDPAWSSALASLRYQAPSLKIHRRSVYLGIGSYENGNAPYCQVEVGSYEAGVYLGRESEYNIPPVPLSMTPHPVFTEETVNEYGAPGSFRLADIDGDGRVDLVLSARVGGAWRKVGGPDCYDYLDEAEYADAVVRVVFLNTGDPHDGGWKRAPELGHPGLETVIPPFVSLEFQDHMSKGLCSGIAWGGDADAASPSLTPEQRIDAEGYCRSFLDFDASFVELDGDGRLDLLVLVPADPRFLPQNVGTHFVTGTPIPACPEAPAGADTQNATILPNGQVYALSSGGGWCHNPTRTRAFRQVANQAGEYSWVPAPEFDLESAPTGSPEHHSYMWFRRAGFPSIVSSFHPSQHEGGFKNSDVGVRLVDLNGDGLTDVLWKDPFLLPESPSTFSSEQLTGSTGNLPFWRHPGGPTEAEGVLLNTGSGWCASWLPAPSGCPHAQRYYVPFPLAIADEAWSQQGFSFYYNGGVRTASYGAKFVDVNGDELVDLLRVVYPVTFYNGYWPFPTEGASEAYLHSPGDPGEDVWVAADDKFRVPVRAVIPIQADGDGVLDWIGLDENDVGFVLRSRSRLPDLLAEIESGKGAVYSFEYTTDAMQFDADLEARAASEAAASAIPGESDESNITRWTRAAVVTKSSIAGPNLLADPTGEGTPVPVVADTTYAYARPRWCLDHRTQMGFRAVETIHPDGSRSLASYHQSHGVRGRKASELVESSTGQVLHQSFAVWEIASGVHGAHPASHVGRIRASVRANQYGAAVGADEGATTRSTYAYDDVYGFNFQSQLQIERPSGGISLVRVPPQSPNTVDWILGGAVEERGYAYGVLQKASRTTYFSTSSGVETLLPARVSHAVQPRGAPEIVGGAGEHVVEWDYDSRGNRVREIVDPDGEALTTTYCYDGDPGCASGHRSHSLVVRTIDPLGNARESLPHGVFPAAEILTSDYVDEPGAVIEYDPFGRILREYVVPEGADATVASAILRLERAYSNSVPELTTTTTYTDADGSDSVLTASVGDGFGGIWKSISRYPSSTGSGYAYVGLASARDPTRRTGYRTLPISCGADDRCSSLTGVNIPRREVVSDALGRPLRDVASDGAFSVHEYAASSLGSSRPWRVSEGPFDLVRTKSARGELTLSYYDGSRLVRRDECRTLSPVEASVVPGCGLDPDTTYFTYEGTGERAATFDPHVAATGGAFPTTGPRVLRFEYDTLGRVVATHDPDAQGRKTAEYDSAGRLSRSTNARQQGRLYSYDALGRVIHVATPAGEANVSITYPPRQLSPSQEFDREQYFSSFEYDALGRLATYYAGLRGRMQTKYEYDLLARPTRITHPIADRSVRTTVQYEYEGPVLRRVCDLDGADSCETAATMFVDDIEYDPLGSITSQSIAGGTRTFEYDPTTRLLTRDSFAAGDAGTYRVDRLMREDDGDPATRDRPLYDESRNLLEIRGWSSVGDFDFDVRYGYDERGRIDSWERLGQGAPRQFEYDALGNLTKNSDRTQVYGDPDRPHAVTSRGDGAVSYTYDADGNLSTISDHGALRYFTFDSDNRMRCIGTTEGGCDLLSVVYSLSGTRLAETAGGTLRRYVGHDFEYKEGTVAAREALVSIRVDGVRVATKRIRGGELAKILPGTDLWLPTPWVAPAFLLATLTVLLAFVAARSDDRRWSSGLASTFAAVLVLQLLHPPQVLAGGGNAGPATISHRWVLSDPVGSSLIELDENGDRLSHSLLEPFGKKLDGVGVAGRDYFAGHPYSADSGFYYMNARWQDPETGRFVSLDPLVPDANDPQSHNPYSYARNNPIGRVDPTGMSDDINLVKFEPVLKIEVKWQSASGGGAGEGGGRHEAGAGVADLGSAGAVAFDSHTDEPGDQVTGEDQKLERGALAAVGRIFKGVFEGLFEGVVDLVVGEDFGAAWRSLFSKWERGPTGGFLPSGIASILQAVRSMLPGNAAANGMHAWHAGSNAALARALGLVGLPFILLGGILHETPLDFGSFSAELAFQGAVNHALDSITDIGANVFGLASGYLVPRTSSAVDFAIRAGNHIPGPGEPDPAFGGNGAYAGNPSGAWGQSP